CGRVSVVQSFQLTFHAAQSHSRNFHQTERIIVSFTAEPNRLAVMFDRQAFAADANRGGKTICNKMRAEIVGKTFIVLKARRKSGNFFARLIENKRNVPAMKEIRRRKSRESGADDCDWFIVFHIAYKV